MGADFPRKIRQSAMGRVSLGVDRRGGREKGKELVCRWREEQVGCNKWRSRSAAEPAVDLACTCHFQGAHIFNQEGAYVKQVDIPT